MNFARQTWHSKSALRRQWNACVPHAHVVHARKAGDAQLILQLRESNITPIMTGAVDQLEETAFEESAHAVIRDFFGDKIVEVAIDEDSGHCDFKRRIDGDKDIALFRNIAGCVAGKVAVERLRGCKVSDESWQATTDNRNA